MMNFEKIAITQQKLCLIWHSMARFLFVGKSCKSVKSNKCYTTFDSAEDDSPHGYPSLCVCSKTRSHLCHQRWGFVHPYWIWWTLGMSKQLHCIHKRSINNGIYVMQAKVSFHGNSFTHIMLTCFIPCGIFVIYWQLLITRVIYKSTTFENGWRSSYLSVCRLHAAL